MSQKMSIYLPPDIFKLFEEARLKLEFNKSEAVQEAIKLWVKAQIDRDIAEACQRERDEDSELTEAAYKISSKHISEML